MYVVVSEEFVSVAGGSTLLTLQGDGRRSSSAAGKAQHVSVDPLAGNVATVASRGGGEMRCALLELSVQRPVDLVIGSRCDPVRNMMSNRKRDWGRQISFTHCTVGVCWPDTLYVLRSIKDSHHECLSLKKGHN